MEIWLGPPADPRASLKVRRARFEDVAALLHLIEGAVEHGCRRHYRPTERRAVFLSYAQSFFVDVLAGFDTFTAELEGRPVGLAQVVPKTGRLRGLFVDGALQQRGVGRLLLSHVTEHVAARGAPRIYGAMSLNAVPFYARAGFRPYGGRDWIVTLGIHVPVVPMEKLLTARR